MQTYLGQKGYTVAKKDLSEELKKQIVKDMFIIPKASVGKPQTYSILRESANKFYLPRFYGIQKFGLPQDIKIKEGGNISLNFTGELREMQKQAVANYMACIDPVAGGGGLLEIFCGGGKTCTALYITQQLGKRTLIIVHKEFLMNQWMERIQQFLPNAKVGKIQGKKIDIEGKDIVLVMLQSLSMKDYDDAIFADFGLTIIDEVHHIASEVFSRALTKVVTKYVLGLSATMNRLDGTTYVIKMYLGEVAFKAVRKDDNVVNVRAIHYNNKDPEYTRVIRDYAGQTQCSSMISKLCLFEPRNLFILGVIADMFLEDPEQQLMVLSHNRNILEYFHKWIEEKNIATVGYYVGGMKEKDLKTTESKQIVLATYSMASEALDIPSLTTLVMATPKVSIEQSVGRILRMKHNNPVIVDIVDSPQLFKNQWYKRKKFYNQQNYKIIQINSDKYSESSFSSSAMTDCINDDDNDDDEEVANDLLKTIVIP